MEKDYQSATAEATQGIMQTSLNIVAQTPYDLP
jgi:hypothetical protein